MKAVILAGGRGKRLEPLTNSSPKALVQINDKVLLEHILNSLVGIVDEVIIVVGYLGNKIKEHLKNSYKTISIKYVTQEEQLGTGHALLCAKELVLENKIDKFLVINGDDVYSNRDLKRLVKEDAAVLSYTSQTPELFGVIVEDPKSKKLLKIVEKPQEFISFDVNTGVYVFPKEIFNHTLQKSQRGEYEIIDYINYLINELDTDVKVVRIKNFWVPVNNLEQLKEAEHYLRILQT